jgi:hypothetical protein
MTRMPLACFLALTSVANLAISIAYAVLGARLSD